MLKVSINKVSINKEELVGVEASGNLPEILTDVSYVIKVIHDGLDKELKEDFIRGIQGYLNEGIYKLSGEELSKKVAEKKKKCESECESENQEEKAEIVKDIKSLIERLKKALEK